MKRFVVRLAALFLTGAILLSGSACRNGGNGGDAESSVTVTAEPTTVISDTVSGIAIFGVAPYAGAYVEDGSDSIVSGVAAVTLTSTDERVLRYAEVVLTADGEEYAFDVSTVVQGERVRVLEKTGKQYKYNTKYHLKEIRNAVFFEDGEYSLHQQTFTVSASDGNITMKNISGGDIAGDIYVYYKNRDNNVYMGGITYRAAFTGGLAAGEQRTTGSSHFKSASSEIMFITYG